jgi:cytoskeletal protein RodZ
MRTMTVVTPGGVGAALRRLRESRGISLHDIAASTKLSRSALEAIERDDIGRLPGGIFTRAVVRAYAKELGADPERTLREFLGQFPDQRVESHAAPRDVFAEAATPKADLARLIVALGILIVPVAFGLLWFASLN